MTAPHLLDSRGPSPAASVPLRVVLVDDSQVIRQRLVEMLTTMEGVQVVGEATSAREGAELICRVRPDVVILDIRMPDGSGFRLLEQIRDLTPTLTVAVLTNCAYPAYRRRSIELGATCFYDKSTEFHRVRDLVRRMQRQGTSPAAGAGSLTILLVEDSAADARQVEEALRDWGVPSALYVVPSTEEALEFLRRQGRHAAAPRPDLVLLDLYLGDRTGFEVLQQMKASMDLQPIPVVVVSGSSNEQDVARSYALQANSYVAKPLDPPRHLAAVLGGTLAVPRGHHP